MSASILIWDISGNMQRRWESVNLMLGLKPYTGPCPVADPKVTYQGPREAI